jgi:hypothetical protein
MPKSLPSDVTRACREINAFVTKLARAEKDVDNYQRSIGQHIQTIKKKCPKDWLAIIERQCNLKKTRIYEFLQIAGGRKTPDQIRGDANRRKIKHRDSVPERKNSAPAPALVVAEQPIEQKPEQQVHPVTVGAAAPVAVEIEEKDSQATALAAEQPVVEVMPSPWTHDAGQFECVAKRLFKADPDLALELRGILLAHPNNGIVMADAIDRAAPGGDDDSVQAVPESTVVAAAAEPGSSSMVSSTRRKKMKPLTAEDLKRNEADGQMRLPLLTSHLRAPRAPRRNRPRAPAAASHRVEGAKPENDDGLDIPLFLRRAS